jgi:hypothetical protein
MSTPFLSPSCSISFFLFLSLVGRSIRARQVTRSFRTCTGRVSTSATSRVRAIAGDDDDEYIELIIRLQWDDDADAEGPNSADAIRGSRATPRDGLRGAHLTYRSLDSPSPLLESSKKNRILNNPI